MVLRLFSARRRLTRGQTRMPQHYSINKTPHQDSAAEREHYLLLRARARGPEESFIGSLPATGVFRGSMESRKHRGARQSGSIDAAAAPARDPAARRRPAFHPGPNSGCGTRGASVNKPQLVRLQRRQAEKSSRRGRASSRTRVARPPRPGWARAPVRRPARGLQGNPGGAVLGRGNAACTARPGSRLRGLEGRAARADYIITGRMQGPAHNRHGRGRPDPGRTAAAAAAGTAAGRGLSPASGRACRRPLGRFDHVWSAV